MSRACWVVAAALALAVLRAPANAELIDYTDDFNALVTAFFSNISETVHIDRVVNVTVYLEGLSDVRFTAADIDVTGHKDTFVEKFTYNTTSGDVKITCLEPTLEIFVHNLSAVGTLFGNIEINGTGDGWFYLEEFRMTIEGPTSYFNYTDNTTRPIIVFDDVVLTLGLWRWTVDMRGLTPGSDLTQMMNSFFSMLGPEIFDTMGKFISNYERLLLKFVNGFFEEPNTTGPSTTGPGIGATDLTTVLQTSTDAIEPNSA